jgi:long-subunit fatty acid transport protein
MVRLKTKTGVLSILLVLGMLEAAFASGLFLPTRHPRGQAMGGTAIANTADLTAISENPGGLTALTTTTFQVSYTLLHMQNSFKRDAYPSTGIEESPQYPETGNVANQFNHIPNLFAGSNFGVEDLYVAAGLWTPIGPRHKYDPYGAQRYTSILNQNSLAYFGFGAAYRIHKMISLGATLAFANIFATQHIGLEVLPNSISTDGQVRLNVTGMFLPFGIFGITIQPIDSLRIGFSYQTRTKAKLEGTVEAYVPILAGRDNAYGVDNVYAEQNLPDELKLGVGWTADRWSVEAAMKMYRWSVYDKLSADLETNKIGDFTIDDLEILKNNRDALSFHLGGSFDIVEDHTLMAGWFYDQAAIDVDYVSITEFDSPKQGLSAGYAVKFAGFRFTLTGMKMLFTEVESPNSQLTSISALGDASLVGSGTYLWNLWTVGGSLEYSF